MQAECSASGCDVAVKHVTARKSARLPRAQRNDHPTSLKSFITSNFTLLNDQRLATSSKHACLVHSQGGHDDRQIAAHDAFVSFGFGKALLPTLDRKDVMYMYMYDTERSRTAR